MGRPEEASGEPDALPTAPPPPYEQATSAYNLQNTSFTPDTYKPVPVVHETPSQAANVPYQPAPSQHPVLSTTATGTVQTGLPMLLGPQPLRTTCPNCRASIQTQTTRKYNVVAHFICLGLCLVGCCLCSCIPYCVDSLKLIEHTCPKCKAHLGTYKPEII